MAFCSFSNARTSIWRTRSRLTPYCEASSSSVVGSSRRRRSVRMWRSRSVSSVISSSRRAMRMDFSSFSASWVSWLTALSSASQSCHSFSLSARSGAFSQAPVHRDHFLVQHAEPGSDDAHLVGVQIAFFQRADLALGLAQVEEQLLL